MALVRQRSARSLLLGITKKLELIRVLRFLGGEAVHWFDFLPLSMSQERIKMISEIGRTYAEDILETESADRARRVIDQMEALIAWVGRFSQ
jgi:hypothetical protein